MKKAISLMMSIALIIGILCGCNGDNGKMEINRVGIEKYTIVYSAEASQGIRTAAEDLVSYIAQATGYTLPCVTDAQGEAQYEIVIGATNRDTQKIQQARASIQNDGYALVAEGKRLFITGSVDRGTVFGIYSFLEDYCGVRFYASDYTVVHKEAVKDVPGKINEVYNPTFLSRDVYWADVIRNPQFALSCKDNSGTLPTLNGGGIAYAGGYLAHTLGGLSGIGDEIGRQPCLTDETVYKTVLTNVRALLDANPDATIISVSQNDSYDGQLGCQCSSCKAIDDAEGSPMGSMLTFVNRIANDIKDDYPNVYVHTLAYRYTRQAPKTVVPADNVIVGLCTIECCFAHSLSDESCKRNAAFVKDIEQWAAICNNLFIWDYTTDYLQYLAPFPNLHVLRENVQFFAQHHVIGLFEQGNHQSVSGEFGELKAYMLSKLLWNPDMTQEEYDKLMDEFLRDYYGAGWKSIREYIDMTSEIVRGRTMCIFDSVDGYMPLVNDEGRQSADRFYKMLELWDNAYAAAENDLQKAHVERSRIQVLYYSQFADMIDAAQREDYRRQMYEAIDKYGITYYREGVNIPAHDGAYPIIK